MDVVRRSDERGVATLTLDSPHNRNALSTALVGQLLGHLRDIATDPGARVVVLTHTGSTFCAGADLREASELSPETRSRQAVDLMRAIVELPKPVVARVDGNVRAGGFGLVGACDIALGSTRASFALTEVRLGLAASIVSLTVLPRLTSRAASRYLLTGERFDAVAAAEAGLLTEAAEDVDALLTRYVEELRLGSPQGLAASKALTTRALLASFDADAERLAAQSAALFASAEAREGMTAFFQRRPPAWVAADGT